MKIYIASDHAGYELKEKLIDYLIAENGNEIIDKGAFEYNEKDDYPDFVSKVAQKISENPEAKGIILGGSGQGEAITANRFKGVRAVVYYGGDEEIIVLSRQHNDANILSLGARFLSEDEAKNAVKKWLSTDFSEGDRHIRRIKKIDSFNDFASF